MPSSQTASSPSDRGFALIITITLLAFLVLLLVSLASLTRVETQVASNNQQVTQARQNALFALNIALGRLQKEAGPDQRSTASAEILASTDTSKKKWTGVWNTTTPSVTPVWLVSGDNPNPTSAITLNPALTNDSSSVRLVGSKSADIDSTTPANASNEIVVPIQPIKASEIPGMAAVAGGITVGNFGYWVGDEGIKARINLRDAYKTETDYASRINRVALPQRTAWELFSGSTSPTPASPDPKTIVTPDMLARTEGMLGGSQLKLIASASSDAPAGADEALRKLSTSRFHDYTLWSAGVQSDVKNGGLKWDLSSAFELSTNLALTHSGNLFQTSEFGSSTIPKRDPASNEVISPVLSFSSASTSGPRVSFVYMEPVTYSNGSTSVSALLRGPTWNLLRSHYLLYRERTPFAASSELNMRSLYPNGKTSGLGDQNMPPSLYEANPSRPGMKDVNTNNTLFTPAIPIPRLTQGSLAPYISRMFVRFGIRTVPKGIPGHPEVRTVQLVMTPFVVLHNPYNVDIRMRSLSGKSNPSDPSSGRIAAQINLFASTGSGLPLSTRIKVNGNDYMHIGDPGTPDTRPGTQLVDLVSNQTGGWPRFRLLVPEMTLKAGEVRLLYPQRLNPEVPMSMAPGSDNTYITMNTTPQENGGFIISQLNGRRDATNGYKIKNHLGIPDINPGDMLPNSTTTPILTDVEFSKVTANGASEIWCKDGDLIRVVMNANGGSLEIKYGIESFTGDDASDGGWGNWSLTYQLNAEAPQYVHTGSPSGAETYSADYANYKRPDGSRADNYERPASGILAESANSTRYFFALDFYAKSADHAADKATRPFITSNPLAFVQYTDALGDQGLGGSTAGTRGFPNVTPSYQLDFIDMSPTSGGSLLNYIYSDNGKANWGLTRESISTLDNSTPGLSNLSLVNVPSRPLTSIADLQHANIASYGYQPYFAIGNSYASPYVPAAQKVNAVGFVGNAANPYFLYDLSYLTNEALWDGYFFSSLSQEFSGSAWNQTDAAFSASTQAWANGTRILPNARMIPYNSSRTTAAANLSTLKTVYRQAAASLITEGSFNVNSRSVDAWAAVLGAARNLDVVTNNAGSIATTATNNATAIPRMLPARLASNSSSPVLSDETWNGFASLSDAQIRQLAKNLVEEITRRQSAPANPNPGPFRSLAEFINRNLRNDLSLGNSTGAKGAIQAALDEPNNSQSPNYRFFSDSSFRDVRLAQENSKWAFKWRIGGAEVDNSLAGQGPTTSTAQGFVLQADILQQIGPYLSARSDTFVIRSFGEAINPITGESTGRAWCEAVVQRLPEYVDQTDPKLSTAPSDGLKTALYDATPVSSVGTINQAFGRRFKIVNFRWLTPQDI